MQVIIIGANAAGLSAASQVKRQKPDWNVVVFEQRDYISYAACGIPYYVQGLVSDLDQLITITPEDAIKKRNLDLRLNCPVESINIETKTVIANGANGRFELPYDRLLIATGARPQQGKIDYRTTGRIFNAHNLKDAESIRRFIQDDKPATCAVIGGGYIAIEMLEAFMELGLETHLIHRRSALARSFEKEISSLTLAEMKQEGVILQLDQAVQAIREVNGQVEVKTAQDLFRYDFVVVATGVEPVNKLAADCGVELGVGEAIRVNAHMETSTPDIFAAGDCAETRNIITGKATYLPLALKANKEGMIAGLNISGEKVVFPGVLGSAITKFMNLGLARTGLTLQEAEENGFNAVKIKVEANSKSHYYPGRGTLTVLIVADKNSGRLLGAQLAGPVDGVKRIDTFITAITAGYDLDQLFSLDLAYAPPFSPVYDPVALAGRVGRKKVER